MAELLESQSYSETASKSHQTSSENCFLSKEADWTKLPSRRTNNTTFTSGYSQDGMAVIGVREYDEDNWAVVYDLITEGGSEPVSNILGDEEAGILSFDLPYNIFEKKDDAVEYAEILMQVDLEGLFREYGLKPDPLR
jgi:hypothetical protein